MSQTPLRTDELEYDLPAELIARRPAEPRDSARLLVVHPEEDRIEHRGVRDLPEYLVPEDVLVFNNSAVIPARLVGRRADTGGAVEGLFLEHASGGRWLVMLRSNSRLRPGQAVELLDPDGNASGHTLELLEKAGAEWIVQPDDPAVLERVGRTPLPPYILRARGDEPFADALDRRWYQTAYADPARRGSVAAPTAGLHFTPDLLRSIASRGTDLLNVTLHVGPGTFKPIETDAVAAHPMHAERYEIDPDTLDRLRALEQTDRRLIAVGSTSVRVLESLPGPLPATAGGYRGETSLLIAPPYRFRRVHGMLTNFHLPRSTLLALVAAMVGLDRLKTIYREAIAQRYRFYSYGDAMLILPPRAKSTGLS